MEYKLVTGLTQAIITAVQNSAVAINRTLGKTLSVKVTNPIKKVDVSGQVVVANLKNLDKPLKQLKEATLGVKSSVEGIKKLEITNFPDKFEVANPPEDKTHLVVEAVKKLALDVQSLHKLARDEIKVSNQPTKELSKVEKAVFEVSKRLAQIKLDPQINVQAPKPERVIVPPAQVNVEKVEIDYQRLAQEVAAVTKEIDYKKLASILAKEMAGMVITSGGGGGGTTFRDTSGNRTAGIVDQGYLKVKSASDTLLSSLLTEQKKYKLHDVVSTDTYQYLGKAASDGSWEVVRITLADQTMRYARGEANYPTNWTNRESLSYTYIYA